MTYRMPLVSISCITYNHVAFIRDCLDGFLIQKTDFPFEILINDDASTDGTDQVIKEYEEKYPDILKPIYQRENQYSKGIRGMNIRFNFPRVLGKYIAMCEGDDYWTDPYKLQKQVDFLEANPDFVMCHHDARRIDSAGNILSPSELSLNGVKGRDYSSEELLRCPQLLLTLTLCFRNILKAFPKKFYKTPNGDTFLINLLGHYGKAKYLGNLIQPDCYRIHSGGIYSSKTNLEQEIMSQKTYFYIFRFYISKSNFSIANCWFNIYINTLLRVYRLSINDKKPISLLKFHILCLRSLLLAGMRRKYFFRLSIYSFIIFYLSLNPFKSITFKTVKYFSNGVEFLLQNKIPL